MSIEESLLNIRTFLEKQNAKVRSNAVVVERTEVLNSELLHITLDKKPVYTPRIGQKQADSEDRTVPRITTSDTLIGCIIGHSMVDRLALEDPPWRNDDYLNGFSIRAFDWEVALKPNGRLVYDQIATNEHWLVGYDQDHQVYPTRLVGQFYVKQTLVVTRPERSNDNYLTLRVRAKSSIQLTEKERLEPGYYEVEFLLNNKTTFRKKVERIKPISQSEYRDTGGLVLSPLSIQNDVLSAWSQKRKL